jgi:hypothetical protein
VTNLHARVSTFLEKGSRQYWDFSRGGRELTEQGPLTLSQWRLLQSHLHLLFQSMVASGGMKTHLLQ